MLLVEAFMTHVVCAAFLLLYIPYQKLNNNDIYEYYCVIMLINR